MSSFVSQDTTTEWANFRYNLLHASAEATKSYLHTHKLNKKNLVCPAVFFSFVKGIYYAENMYILLSLYTNNKP